MVENEITDSYKQQNNNGIVESYILLTDQSDSTVILAIIDNKLATFLVGRSQTDWSTAMVYNDDKTSTFIK